MLPSESTVHLRQRRSIQTEHLTLEEASAALSAMAAAGAAFHPLPSFAPWWPRAGPS